MCKLFTVFIFVSVFYFSTPAYSGFTKADYLACDIYSTSEFDKEKLLDGFTCAMWAKAIKNPKSVGEIFKNELKNNLDIEKVEDTHKHGHLPFSPLELSFRTLCAATSHPKITVGKALKIIENCSEEDIDWGILTQRMTMDMPQFIKANNYSVSNQSVLAEEIKSEPSAEYLLKNNRLIQELNYGEHQKLIRLVTEPVKLFPAFFNIDINSFNLVEQKGDTAKQTETFISSLRSNQDFTVAKFAENLLYAKKYLDIPIDFTQISEIFPENSQKILPPKQSNFTPPYQTASYQPHRTGTRKRSQEQLDRKTSGQSGSIHPTHTPLPTHKPIPKSAEPNLLTDEGLYLFAVYLNRGYSLSRNSFHGPYKTLELIGCSNYDFNKSLITRERISELLLSFRTEHGPEVATKKIKNALTNDRRDDIRKHFTQYRPFLQSTYLRKIITQASPLTNLTEECIDTISASLTLSGDTFEENNFLGILFMLGMKFHELTGSITGNYCEPDNAAKLIKGWMKANPSLAKKEILIAALNHTKNTAAIEQVNKYYTEKNKRIKQIHQNPHIKDLAKYIASFYLAVANYLNVDKSKIPEIDNKNATDEDKATHLLCELIDKGEINLNTIADLSNLKDFFSGQNPNRLASENITLDDVLGQIPEDRLINNGEHSCAICEDNVPNTTFGCCQNSCCKSCFKDLFDKGAPCPTCRKPINLNCITGFRLNTAPP